MKEIPWGKRLEIARYYILGHTYKEIEEETGISHGSIANIVSEVEQGALTIPGIPSDQINDLRQLSFELKKKGLELSQALLGISFFKRLQAMDISPERLDRWSELTKRLVPADFPTKDFVEAALRLHELEKSYGKSFEILTEEYIKLQQETDKLREEVKSLDKKKAELAEEVEPLSLQVEKGQKEKRRLENDAELLTVKLRELTLKVKETEKEKHELNREIKDLRGKKVKLCSEVDGKEESLRRLNDIGFPDEDLLRLRNLLGKIAKKEGTNANQLKDSFLRALDHYASLSELQKAVEKEAETLKKTRKEKAVLTGEIAELEKRKAVLQGETCESASLASQTIRGASEETVSQIQQEAEAIREQLKAILADILIAAGAVAEMKALKRKGEESVKELADFIKEVQGRVEVQ
jgi:chromosome segregation ATPase